MRRYLKVLCTPGSGLWMFEEVWIPFDVLTLSSFFSFFNDIEPFSLFPRVCVFRCSVDCELILKNGEERYLSTYTLYVNRCSFGFPLPGVLWRVVRENLARLSWESSKADMVHRKLKKRTEHRQK